jgi:hypothetical protein
MSTAHIMYQDKIMLYDAIDSQLQLVPCTDDGAGSAQKVVTCRAATAVHAYRMC